MPWKIYATDPPQLKQSYAPIVSWALTIIMMFLAVLHLVRIDKLVPVLERALPGSTGLIFIVFIVIAEVFALPFLLRLKLSLFMRLVSGLLVVVVPLAWTCLSIWLLHSSPSTGQFSSYVSTQSNWWLVCLNVAWLAASYWLLWLYKYNLTAQQATSQARAFAKK